VVHHPPLGSEGRPDARPKRNGEVPSSSAVKPHPRADAQGSAASVYLSTPFQLISHRYPFAEGIRSY
jgi:hypothetical protein